MHMDQGLPGLSRFNLEAEIDEVNVVSTEEIDEAEIDENNVVPTEEMTFNKKCRGDKNFWKYRKIDSTSITGFPF